MAGSWSIPLDRVAQRLGMRLDVVARRVTLGLAKDAIQKTPVDTGLCRGSWVHGVGRINETLPDTEDIAGDVSITRITASYNTTPVASVHYISNNLPYAVALERHHSRQAPHGMVRVSIIELLTEMDVLVGTVRREYSLR